MNLQQALCDSLLVVQRLKVKGLDIYIPSLTWTWPV